MDKVSSAGNLPNESYKKAAESEKKTTGKEITKKKAEIKDSESGDETKSATKDKKKSA